MEPDDSVSGSSITSESKTMQSVSEKDDRELIPVNEDEDNSPDLDVGKTLTPNPATLKSQPMDLLGGMMDDHVGTPVKEFSLRLS